MKLKPYLEDKVLEMHRLSKTAPKLVKIDVSEFEDLGYEMKITSIPCLILVRNGKTVKRLSGHTLNQRSLDEFMRMALDIGSDS